MKHEETINKKVLMTTPKDQNVDLGATKSTHLKKKFKNHNKNPHDHPRRNTKKYDKSILEFHGIGSVLIQGKVIEDVLFLPMLWMTFM